MIVKLLTEHQFGVSKLKRRLIRVYTCQNIKLLEISCHDSNNYNKLCVVFPFSFQFTAITGKMFVLSGFTLAQNLL